MNVLIICSVINLFFSIAVYFLAKRVASKCRNPGRIALAAVTAWYCIPLIFIWHSRNYFPMPKDEYMVDLFIKNRGDFEKIVKEYREEYLIGDNSIEWDFRQETKAMEKRLGIKTLSYRSDMNWFESPYSSTFAKEQFDKILHGNIPPVRDKRMRSVIVDLHGSMQSSMRSGSFITKSYLHLPMRPKIEGGKLYYPYNHLFDSDKQPFMYMRDSLDQYQNNWDKGQCFLKEIDTQWFIQLCRSD